MNPRRFKSIALVCATVLCVALLLDLNTAEWDHGPIEHKGYFFGENVHLFTARTIKLVTEFSGLTAMAVLLFCVITAVVISARSRKRSAAGLCIACGYDLRANSARCPECGRMRDCEDEVED
jgi:hypothetical protein